MDEFNKRLKKLRLERKLTMRAAAKLIGIPETTYREWEYGRKIQGEPYLSIANAFGVSISELLEDESAGLTIEQRLDRIKNDVNIVHSELKKSKK